MKLATLKDANQIKIPGTTADIHVIDGSVKGLTLRNAETNDVLLDVRESGYSIQISVPAPPRMVKAYRLHGTVMGLPVDEKFSQNQRTLATQRKQGFESKGFTDLHLEIENVEIPEEEAAALDQRDEIPF